LINLEASLIVPAMKRTAILFALILASTLPTYAQSSEFGVIIGGSRRIINSGAEFPGDPHLNESFSLSNGSFDLYWSIPIDGDTNFRIKLGRIEGPVAFASVMEGDDTVYRRDVDGEVQHIAGIIDYRFDEPWGSTGLFGGIGLYRQTAPGFDSRSDYGFTAGLNADFPLTRRFGVIAEVAYHWTRGDFDPRYLTGGAGLRVRF
jgi:hypothetical protein